MSKKNLHIRGVIAVILAGLLVVAAPERAEAQGQCYVDYKAKKNAGGSLQLHYGVMQVGGKACKNPKAASRVVAARLNAGGWTLLRVLSRFDQSGLGQRQGNAGQYFLRY